LEQMCAALSRAHDLGVVHRDLKSDNIMLTARGGRNDFVKILDFGLAALTRDPRLAPKGAVFGTPEYMSPEQARGEDATSISDLYSLGILFFEMLAGQLPFRSRSRESLLEMQRSAAPPKLRALNPEVPERAEQIIHKLLQKDADKRFRDGHHLQEELKALQRSLPTRPWEIQSGSGDVSAAPPPPPPAPSAGVVEWSRRASNFLRLTARAYPNRKTPKDVEKAGSYMWDLAARASQLEGELATHSKRLQVIEKRGRAFRAEIGRKVEELAEEESRTLREAASEHERTAHMTQLREQAKRDWSEAHRRAERLVEDQGSTSSLCKAFEVVGAARARVEALAEIIEDYQHRAGKREREAKGLRRQIEDLRDQLQRYSEALESELSTGRDRIASLVREALNYEREFMEASAKVIEHLQGRPECKELLEEVSKDMQGDMRAGRSSGARPARQAPTYQLAGASL